MRGRPNALPSISLPDEANRAARQEDLATQRTHYDYNLKPAFLPDTEPFKNAKLPLHKSFPEIERAGANKSYWPRRWIQSYLLPPIRVIGLLNLFRNNFIDPLDKIDDYEKLFILLKKPAIAKLYRDDAAFAEQRLSGSNPVRLARLSSDDERAKVLDSKLFDSDVVNVKDALASGNVYVTDYTGNDPTYKGPSFVKARMLFSYPGNSQHY
jgi:arachidonate 15-lipoxygenase